MLTHQAARSPLHVHSTPTTAPTSRVTDNGATSLPRQGAFSTPSYSATVRAPTLSIAVNGQWAKLSTKLPGPPTSREWRRGNVTAFSARSRSRMLQAMWRSDLSNVIGGATFVTLTYPADYPTGGPTWKAQLDAFDKRFRRAYRDCWYFWKLEPQKRGAPHFHLLVFGAGRIDRAAVKTMWQEVIGSSGMAAWNYGAWVQPLKSWRQAGQYCSKYAAKVIDEIEWDQPGRFWGIKGRANRIERIQTIELTEVELYRIRRIFKRLIRAANGYHRPGGSRSGVWARCSNETAKRALESASSAPASTSQQVKYFVLAPDDGAGMRSGGIDSYSKAGWPVSTRTTIGRTHGSTRTQLMSQEDQQARRARRLTA